MYAAISVTPYYGPECRHRLLSLHATEVEARGVAHVHNSGRAYGIVSQAWQVDLDNLWDSLPVRAQEECLDISDCVDPGDFDSALESAGYKVLEDERTGERYLVDCS